MKAVVDFEKTITIKRVDRNFVLTHLGSGKEVTLNAKEFFGNFFKYEGEFFDKFKKTFPDQKIEYFVFSNEASDLMFELLFFNVMDN